ncbi:MAG: glycosyltransferase family 4 protein, partial [Rubrobacteridae bacterium]|nr:glycosyltransferase family 4 protein [Rubrobacteridae bacterium]
LADLDLFAFPSTHEPFGIAILEALAMGIPVVATKAGGIPEIITDNHNGLLAKPNDEYSLAACIKKLIEDETLRCRLTENGRRHVVDNFSIDTMTAKISEVYNKSLHQYGASA